MPSLPSNHVFVLAQSRTHTLFTGLSVGELTVCENTISISGHWEVVRIPRADNFVEKDLTVICKLLWWSMSNKNYTQMRKKILYSTAEFSLQYLLQKIYHNKQQLMSFLYLKLNQTKYLKIYTNSKQCEANPLTRQAILVNIFSHKKVSAIKQKLKKQILSCIKQINFWIIIV